MYEISGANKPATVQATALVPAVVEQRPLLPAVIAANPVGKARETFALVTSDEALLPEKSLVTFAHRHSNLNSTLGIAGFFGGVATFFGAFIMGEAMLMVPAVVSAGVCVASTMLETKGKALIQKAKTRVLDSSDVEPVLTMLRGAPGGERALMRLVVEEETERLESSKRLTPKAAMALRDLLGAAAGNDETLDRGTWIVGFVNRCLGGSAPVQKDVLEDHLRAAPVDERVTLGDYLDAQLFPKEIPLKHFSVEDAKALYAIVDKARRGEASQAPREGETSA